MPRVLFAPLPERPGTLLVAGALVLASPLVLGCNDPSLIDGDPESVDTTGAISGRVCAPDGQGWLENAYVYTNLYDDDGVLVGIRETYTDRDGYFLLSRVPEGPEIPLYIQKSTFQATLTASVVAGSLTSLPPPACLDPLSVNAAVISGEYDSFSALLEQVGISHYVPVDGTDATALATFLSSLDVLLGFDLLCLNGGMLEAELLQDPLLISNLVAYVEAGGALLATDWAYDWVEASFPDAIDFAGDDTQTDDAQVGAAEVIPDARVTDQSLALYLGRQEIEVRYDLAYWPLIVGTAGSVTLHVSGDVHYYEGWDVRSFPASPLLVSFTSGYGSVVYSTFRGEANQDEDMTRVLQYMIYLM